MDAKILSTDRLDLEGDIVFRLQVLIGGPLLLRDASNTYREELVCTVFVQEAECRSSDEDDLLRCASRRIEELAKEAHAMLARQTL
jgi:hypothetical protein